MSKGELHMMYSRRFFVGMLIAWSALGCGPLDETAMSDRASFSKSVPVDGQNFGMDTECGEGRAQGQKLFVNVSSRTLYAATYTEQSMTEYTLDLVSGEIRTGSRTPGASGELTSIPQDNAGTYAQTLTEMYWIVKRVSEGNECQMAQRSLAETVRSLALRITSTPLHFTMGTVCEGPGDELYVTTGPRELHAALYAPGKATEYYLDLDSWDLRTVSRVRLSPEREERLLTREDGQAFGQALSEMAKIVQAVAAGNDCHTAQPSLRPIIDLLR